MDNQSAPGIENCEVLTNEAAIEAIAELDLSYEDIVEAVTIGHDQAALKSIYHPLTARGLTRWMETVAAIRQAHAEDRENSKSRIVDEQNRPLLRHKSRNLVLAIAAGDRNVGDPNAMPNFLRAKGKATQDALIQISDLQGIEIVETWFLLYRPQEDCVRCELSLGVGNDSGKVEEWRRRLLFTVDNLEVDTRFVEGGEDLDFRIS